LQAIVKLLYCSYSRATVEANLSGSRQLNADPVEFLKVIAGVVGESAAFELILRCEFRSGQKLSAKAEK
jgi:hypothetical protein